MTAIEARGLGRVYASRRKGGAGGIVALDDVSLTVERGEIHGLLGPNGAGKTTFVKILSTLLVPTSGSATVLGHDVVAAAAAVRPLIGIVFGGERGLYPRLTARQNLDYFGALYGLDRHSARRRCNEVLERLGLAERADDRVETYSRGMKQRLHLARGLLNEPELLFLDEPTTGLDPTAAHDFRRLIEELVREGTTILLTTHDMAEAEALCKRVTLIDRGRILATETPSGLSSLVDRALRVDAAGVTLEAAGGLRRLVGVERVEAEHDGRVRIVVRDRSAIPGVLALLAEAGVSTVHTSVPTLEEVYLELLGPRGFGV